MDLQRKRDVFREEIRQRQIQQLFAARREQVQQEQGHFIIPSQQVLLKNQNLISEFVKRLSIHQKNADYSGVIGDINFFTQELDTNCNKLSYSINQFLHENGMLLQEMSQRQIPIDVLGQVEEQEMNQIKKQQPKDVNEYRDEILVVLKLMKLCQRIKLSYFTCEASLILIKLIWNVIKEKYHLPVEEYPETHQQSREILISIIQVFTVLLQNQKNSEKIRSNLQQLGFSEQLNIIIDLSTNNTDDFNKKLLQLLLFYSTEKRLTIEEEEKQNKKYDIFDDIHLISVDTPFKEKQLSYCLYFLINERTEFYELVLLVMDELLNSSCFLIDALKFEYLLKIAELILSNDRKIMMNALSVINTIVYYNEVATQSLIKKADILDIIYKRLREERDVSLPNRNLAIKKCTVILSDCLLSKERKTKEILQSHPIWEFIFESITEENPLLPTVVVFEYYFQNIGRKKSLNFTPSFFNAISGINLEGHGEHIQEIKRMIVDIYYRAQEFWPEEEFEILNNHIQLYNLKFILLEE